jgi:hypothetical protein
MPDDQGHSSDEYIRRHEVGEVGGLVGCTYFPFVFSIDSMLLYSHLHGSGAASAW